MQARSLVKKFPNGLLTEVLTFETTFEATEGTIVTASASVSEKKEGEFSLAKTKTKQAVRATYLVISQCYLLNLSKARDQSDQMALANQSNAQFQAAKV